MRIILSIFLLLGGLKAFAQSGNYFLSHYSTNENQFDNVCFDMAQDKHGLMYFATRGGVQQFDGRSWKTIKGNGAIYSIEIAGNGDIIWAGAAGYGKLEITKTGEPILTKLSDENVKNVFQNLIIEERSYFISEQSISVYDLKKHEASTIVSTNLTGSFLSAFELFGNAYLNTERAGVLKIEGGKFVQTALNVASGTNVIFSSGSDRRYVLGMSDNKVYLCGENMQLVPLRLEDSTYVDASVIIQGTWVNRDLIVLGTLRGGLVFIHPMTGKTQEIINYNTGLPDNEIYAMMIDKSQGIWAAHEYGFTRVAPYLPYRSFGHYPGLQGNLLCAASFKGKVFVGTSLGLYKLERDDVYEEIVYYIEEEIKEKKSSSKNEGKKPAKRDEATTTDDEAPPAEQESKKKGFFRFLRRGKDKTSDPLPATTPTVPESAPDKSKSKKEEAVKEVPHTPKFRKVKKTERVLRTSQFVYRKVNDVDAKVTQLIEVDEKLIALGLAGAYEVQDAAIKPILEEPIRMGYYSDERSTLFLSTYSDEIKSFQFSGKWFPSQTLDNLDDQITTIFESHDHELWLLALDKAYRLDISTNAVAESQTIEIHNPSFDEVAGIQFKNEIIIANSQGFYRFDRTKNVFTELDSLSKPLNYFSSHSNVLYKDGHGWHMLSTEAQRNLQLLNLVETPRFVHQDKDADYIWVITSSNGLYKFFGEKFTPYEGGFPLLLRSMHGSEGHLNKRDIFEFDQDKSSLTFEIVQPDYLAANAIEYRYQLKGLDNTWSEWLAKNSTIDYAYLPAGDYKLVVQSRDIFGQVKELEALSFKVNPPYWQTPWFYALEFFVFAGLVLLSFRLSNRFRIISRLLSLLTIIMLIQFIQTVIGEMFETKTSPVLDFFVQVIVAFMILPVEGYLRNLMLRSLDTSSRLYRFLSPKASNTDEEQER